MDGLTVLDGIKKLVDWFAGIGRRLLGMTAPNAAYPAARDQSEDVLTWFRGKFSEDVSRNFSQSRTPDGDPMKPLKYRSGQPLILTGRLRDGAVSAAGSAELRGRDVIAVIASPAYWRFHEYGTRRIPARPFFGPRADTVRELAERTAERVVNNLVGG